MPEGRLASDEDNYLAAAHGLLERGQQDLFWPPVTGWLIAGIRLVLGPSQSLARLVWLMIDLGALFALRALASRVARACWPEREGRFVTGVILAYALYLPAISYAQFTTSETPALLLTLLTLLALTGAGPQRYLAGGAALGALVLTRPSLAPVVVVLPLIALPVRRQALLCIALAVTIVTPTVVHNWSSTGVVEVASSSAYNLFLGNRPMYAEDLDLLSPAATHEQIDIRRGRWVATVEPLSLTPMEQQREAWRWLSNNPVRFARRALGRLARVFVPKTDVLELLGGEGTAGIFSAASLGLLLLTNAQWAIVLFAGLVGLLALRHRAPDLALLFASTIAGATALCLVATSKPRYSFVFDPLLMMAACVCLASPRETLRALNRRDRIALGVLTMFFTWSWLAWVIFAVTSRHHPTA